MIRKISAAALALTVAGGVYLTAGTAQASNMGFKLERSFTPVPNFRNIYLVSYPLFNGLGDVANTGATERNKCVGDADGPATPDGTIDSYDAICDMYTDRSMSGSHSFAVNRINRDTCQFQTSIASHTFTGVAFGGAAFPLNTGDQRDQGFYVTVSATAPAAPINRAVIVGSHDPSYTGRQIRMPSPDCAPRLDYLQVPYHTMYQAANELLCGLETVDWVDADSNGNPDTCTRGIFDGTHAMAVQTFDNIPDSSGTDNQFVARIVTRSFTGALNFSGPNFPLTPGDSYIASIGLGHVTTTFLSPHF